MTDSIRARTTPWHTALLLCGKCARKMKHGGYGDGGEDTLRTALRKQIKAQGDRRGTRVIETRCLGICPKGAVVALNASRPEQVFTIPKGTDAVAVLAKLVGPRPLS